MTSEIYTTRVGKPKKGKTTLCSKGYSSSGGTGKWYQRWQYQLFLDVPGQRCRKGTTETSKQQHPNIPTLLHFRLESTCCNELEFSDFVSGTL